jgi:cytochrome c5
MTMQSRFLFASFLLAPLTVAATTTDRVGQELHDQHCLACHTTSVYSRENRIIHSKDALTNRVAYCAENAAKVTWDQGQVDAVSKYLNDAFYHF